MALKTLSIGALVYFSFLLIGCSTARRDQQAAPNIIFVMADDLGYGDLGCYGATQIPTPNIDRLAEAGMRFTDAHAPASVCTPTRYAVLTGRYAWRSRMKKGVLHGYDPLLIEPGRLTVASLLQSAGYATACIGKWHLGLGDSSPVDYSQPLRPGPLDVGFDYFFGIPASLDMPPYCFIENDRTVGKLTVEKHPYHTLQRKGPMTPGWQDEEVGPTLTRKAIDFIEKNVAVSPQKPFFLYLPYHAPHTPCTPPDFIRGRSEAGVRGDMVVELDWMVGELRDTLLRHGLSENTLFFLTSDNGALTTGPARWAGEPPEKYDLVHHGHRPNGRLRGQKADAYDGGHREPFIAAWPGRIPAGSTSDAIICLVDLMATCAAIVGKELPDNAGEDSHNLLPALNGTASGEAVRAATIHHSSQGMFAIRQGAWKLILGLGSGGFSHPASLESGPGEPAGQLYNIVADPEEKNNVWLDNPQVVARLSGLLDGYQKQGYSRTMGKIP
jgi:arylsulfatase A-like enzyme